MHRILSLYCVLALMVPAFAGNEDMAAAERAMKRGDYAEAFCLLRPMAEDDNAEAQYQLGWMYHNGYGLAVNDLKAAAWWEKAAEEDIVDAQLALVMLYREGGEGVKQDLSKAAKYLLNAVEAGDEESRLLLSYFLERPDWALEQHLADILRTRPEVLGPGYRIDVDEANLRSGPNTGSRVIDTVGQGEKLILLANRGEWSHVVYVRKRKIAWVYSELITEVQD